MSRRDHAIRRGGEGELSRAPREDLVQGKCVGNEGRVEAVKVRVEHLREVHWERLALLQAALHALRQSR